MIDELEVLKIVTKKLELNNIPYMVTGSIAANFYTIPRMTRDIDIIIEINKDDAKKIFSLFADDFYIDLNSIKEAINNYHIFNIIHNTGIVKVDFIIKKNLEYRKVEFERRQSIFFEGMKLYITSPEDLVISKLFWAKDSLSEMQLKDVKNILNTVPALDMIYIKKWISKLGLDDIYKKVKR